MKTSLTIACFLLGVGLFFVSPTPSYAWHGRTYVGVNLGVWPGGGYGYYGGPYYDPYYYPRYYDPYYAAPSYEVVASSNYQPVVVNGVTYYLNNGVYYIYTQYGYQAVAAPTGAVAPAVQTAAAPEPTSVAASDDNAFTINIPNGHGGYNPVVLKRSGQGFVGPQGEFYADFPKVSQLKLMYGK